MYIYWWIHLARPSQLPDLAMAQKEGLRISKGNTSVDVAAASVNML
jgi:hypothetical protein